MAESSLQWHSFAVDRGGAGKRLDLFLHERLPRQSRAFLQRLIRDGDVTVNGASSRPAAKLRQGDKIFVRLPFLKPSPAKAEDIPLEILYEDAALAVVVKPAGMVVHPAAGHRSGTLVNALLHHLKNLSGVGGVERPGLVHRIDKDVSGLLAVAKSDAVHKALARDFKARRVDKRYLALVWGRVKKSEGRITAPIARDPHNRKKMAVVEGGREALTLYAVRERFGNFATLLEVDLRTGRSHQIRVHLRHLGHPIVGDRIYGRAHPTGRERLDGALEGFGRVALHAWRLTLRHPLRGAGMCFEAPAPEEMEALMEEFREAAGREK